MTEHRYAVDKLSFTLHPDGANAGRACVAIHLGTGGEQYTARQLVDKIAALDTSKSGRVSLFGAPWDAELATAIRGAGVRLHVELDGTRALPAPVDWLVVAPRSPVVLVDHLQVDEVKVVVDAAVTEDVLDTYAARWRCEHYVLVGSPERAFALIRARPRWRLSIPIAI